MNIARKLLLTTTASLAILFAGCSARNPALADQPQQPAPTVATVMQDYNTAASQRLKDMTTAFNKDQPPGASPIVYIDYDKVVTWAEMQKNPQSFEQAINDYLKAQTGKTFDAATIEKVFNAMNSQQPTALTPAEGVKGACIVIPEYPGSNFESYYRAGFQFDGKDLLSGKTVIIGLTSQEFEAFADAHESWHCFDIRYRNDTGTGLVGAMKDNRAEMFADVGGAMERIRNGADISLIDKIAAERATWTYTTGHARTGTAEDDPGHYLSIVYNTHPGLYALKERIQQMGIDNFRKLDRAQMRDLDYQIVDAHALNFTQAAGLWSFYATGKAPTAVQGDVAQLRGIAAQSLRKATPQEMAAQSPDKPGTTDAQMTAALKTRASELGDASNISNQLRARAEMTDKLRQQLSAGPSASTQAQADRLFLSSPKLPAKGGT